jgi:hypothetical protein
MKTRIAVVLALVLAGCGGTERPERHDPLAEATVQPDGSVTCPGAATQTITVLGAHTFIDCTWTCAAWIDGAGERHDGAHVQIQVGETAGAPTIYLVNGLPTGC